MASRRSGQKVNPAGNGTTATGRQQFRPAAADSTKAAQHRLPVNSSGPMTLTARQQTTAVTGPGAWENGRDRTAVVGGSQLAGASAADASPSSPPCAGDCGPGGH